MEHAGGQPVELDEDLSLQVLLDEGLQEQLGDAPLALRFAVPLFGSQLTATMQRALRRLRCHVAALSFAPGETGGRKVMCTRLGLF